MKQCKYIKIADIRIKIDISTKIGEIIANQLEATEYKLNKYDIELNFDDSLNFNNDYISAGDNLKYNNSEFLVKFLSDIHYKIDNLFDNKSSTQINIKFLKKGIKSKVKELLYGKNKLEVNSILSYSLFWYIFQYTLLQKNKAFLHAGIFSNENEAFAITGTGGSGKTSNLFKALEDENYMYLAEDFGIVDKDGFTYYNPKPISIYETDMKFNPMILGKYFNKFSLKEKMTWKINTKILGRDPIVKVSPLKLLDNRIMNKSKLKSIFYFIRNNEEKIIYKTINKDELIQRSLNVTLREMRPFIEILFLMQANKLDGFTNLISFKEYIKQIENMYSECFGHTSNYIMYVPKSMKPENIVKYMKDNKLI